jgi:hypothetical protein
MVTVLLENTYSDGHHSERTVELEAPTGDLDEWWEDIVFPETGDGHGIDADCGSCYTATVLAAPAHPELVGLSEEWID